MSKNITIIVTGGSRGIGKAIALKATQYAHELKLKRLILIARNNKRLQEVSNLIRQQNPLNIEVTTISFDLAQYFRISELVNAMGLNENQLFLINNAGYTEPAPLIETSDENFSRTFAVNVFSPIILVRELLRARANLKKVVNVGSTAGMTPRPGWLSYSASKAAIISASLTMYEELLPYGIQVYCLSPGRCATDLRAKLAPDEDQSKIMQPEEVANILVKLLIGDNQALAGQNIIVRRKHV